MLLTVPHLWRTGARSAFNCYRHCAHLLLRQHGNALLILLIREGVAQGDPLLTVLYRINFAPLAEDTRNADLTLLSLFYADDAAFDGLARRSVAQLRLLMNGVRTGDTSPSRPSFLL